MAEKKKDSVVKDTPKLYNRPVEIVEEKPKEIGIDTENKLFTDILTGVDNSTFDMNAFNNFSTSSQNREQIYQLIDTMANDSTIAAILETYAEDATPTNDFGKIMWVESEDPYVNKYITYLLDTINVDKNAYKWILSLCKYGDLYLKLFRESDFVDDLFEPEQDDKKNSVKIACESSTLNEALTSDDTNKKDLKEDLVVKAYKDEDRLVEYLEMMPNPAEMFELTRFGKSYAYIQAPTALLTNYTDTVALTNNFYNYQFNKKDVNIYNATCFVHAALEDNINRNPEKVELFRSESDVSISYSVRGGQSVLYNAFAAWRQLMLLENSLLLNRLTKSSITRILGIEVGDMPKEQVGLLLNRIKQMVEQKSSLSDGNAFTSYTNPGPVENTIYVPLHDGKGGISPQEIGGEINQGTLNDVDYFKDKLFGCLRGSTKIKFSDGTVDTIKHAVENKEMTLEKYINTCDKEGHIIPSKIINALETRKSTEFIKFTLDDNFTIEVTPEHLMMLSDGTYKEAQYITEEDELMSI